MKRLLIDKKHIMDDIETQHRLWGDEYDVKQVLREIDNAVTFDAPDVNAWKWIPVTERLPEKNDVVLVWCESFAREFPCYAIGSLEKGEFWFISLTCGRMSFPVTQREVVAWMPLPEPPKGE